MTRNLLFFCGKKQMKPFDFINEINHSKKDIMVDDISEKSYNAFLVNRGLSYFVDTILYSNEMNVNHHISNRMQFDFLLHSVKSKKRFSKWAKAENVKHLETVKEYYGYSNSKAKMVLPLLNEEQLNHIESKLYKGGKK